MLARAVAARLITGLVDAQAARGDASVVLTGGGVGIAVLRELRDAPARDAVDWSRLEVWWGDERFLPAGDRERNETQAREALLDAVDLDPARVHPMPAGNVDSGDDPSTAADAYARTLATAARPDDPGRIPSFDIVLLGVGPDGHVASLFPGMPAHPDDRAVIAVHDAPKPPPVRVSLTLRAINSARAVWLLASGPEKSIAVHAALSGADRRQIPAAGVSGRSSTLWLLDREAAAGPPGDYVSPRSFASASARMLSPSSSVRRSRT